MADVKHFDPQLVLEQAERLFWRDGPASVGIAEVVSATGVNRSSLYATFGDKQQLYLASLKRYVDAGSAPAFDRITAGEQGLAAIEEFFVDLIDKRCRGPFAGWGCMVTNAHSSPGRDDPEVRRLLDTHHERLRAALREALSAAESQGQLNEGVNISATADLLALLAYGINVRSRAGADAAALNSTVRAALDTITSSER